MTEAVTIVSYQAQTSVEAQVSRLVHTSVFVGGATIDPGSGITQAQADARYVKQTEIASFAVVALAPAHDGDVLEYNGLGWMPTTNPRVLYLDGGNF